MLPTPLGGSQRSFSAKMMDSIRPNQKVGMEMPNRATVMDRLSFQLLRFSAATMPSGMPMPRENTMLNEAIFRVKPKRCKISCLTSRPLV